MSDPQPFAMRPSKDSDDRDDETRCDERPGHVDGQPEAEIVVDETNGRVPVIAGTGESGTKLVIDATKAATDIGADAAIIVTPYYLKPKAKGLYDHYFTIAEKTDMSEKMVEKLQGRAQLAMVPGVKEKDLVLLEEVGVMNRKDLACQEPFELGRKISGIAKVYVAEGKISEAEKPTIEEIYSWIKFAKA